MVSIVAAYFIGSIPMAFLISKIKYGTDIRKVGSGNAGALNIFRQFSKNYGIIVFILDAGKGALATGVPIWLGAENIIVYLSIVATVLGHNFPVFLWFKGGKGVATVTGASFVILPVMTIIAPVTFFCTFLFTRNVIVSIVVAFLVFDMAIISTLHPIPVIILYISLTGIVLITHLTRTRQKFLPALKVWDWRTIIKIE